MECVRNKQQTPKRRKKKCVCPDENHELGLLICQDTSTYFKEKYYEQNTNWPSTCVSCNERFGGPGKKVNQTNPVMACKNACVRTHPCKHAYCNECYMEKMKEKMKHDSETGAVVRSMRTRKPKAA